MGKNGVKWHGKNPNVLKVLENLKSKIEINNIIGVDK